MSHWFELPKKLPPPAKESEVPRTLSVVQSLDHIPTEEVSIQPESRIVLHTDPRGVGADRFRFLRICLRELWNAGKLKSLLITSPLPQDGKSTVALNLATALAENGKRSVLLVEGDLHHPSITEQLGLEPRTGLTDCLNTNLNPTSVLRRLSPLNWYLMPAGTPVDNPTELLQTAAFGNLMQKLQPHFDWILIDAPPVIPVTDSLSLARQTNATLLVTRAGRTSQEALEKTIALLGKHRVLGVILNGVEGLERVYSGYYGYYGYPKNAPAATLPQPGPREATAARAIRIRHALLDLREEQ
jgi:capsular exopolysaccharide synthesis family protein